MYQKAPATPFLSAVCPLCEANSSPQQLGEKLGYKESSAEREYGYVRKGNLPVAPVAEILLECAVPGSEADPAVHYAREALRKEQGYASDVDLWLQHYFEGTRQNYYPLRTLVATELYVHGRDNLYLHGLNGLNTDSVDRFMTGDRQLTTREEALLIADRLGYQTLEALCDHARQQHEEVQYVQPRFGSAMRLLRCNGETTARHKPDNIAAETLLELINQVHTTNIQQSGGLTTIERGDVTPAWRFMLTAAQAITGLYNKGDIKIPVDIALAGGLQRPGQQTAPMSLRQMVDIATAWAQRNGVPLVFGTPNDPTIKHFGDRLQVLRHYVLDISAVNCSNWLSKGTLKRAQIQNIELGKLKNPLTPNMKTEIYRMLGLRDEEEFNRVSEAALAVRAVHAEHLIEAGKAFAELENVSYLTKVPSSSLARNVTSNFVYETANDYINYFLPATKQGFRESFPRQLKRIHEPNDVSVLPQVFRSAETLPDRTAPPEIAFYTQAGIMKDGKIPVTIGVDGQNKQIDVTAEHFQLVRYYHDTMIAKHPQIASAGKGRR